MTVQTLNAIYDQFKKTLRPRPSKNLVLNNDKKVIKKFASNCIFSAAFNDISKTKNMNSTQSCQFTFFSNLFV